METLLQEILPAGDTDGDNVIGGIHIIYINIYRYILICLFYTNISYSNVLGGDKCTIITRGIPKISMAIALPR